MARLPKDDAVSRVSTFPVGSRFPRIRANKPPNTSLVAMQCRSRIDQRELELRRREAIRFFGGVAIMMASVATALSLLFFFVAVRLNPPVHASPEDLTGVVAFLFGLFLLLSVPVALFTRKESRTDVAQQILDEGTRANPHDHPVARLVVVLTLLGLIHGEFMVIDAVKAWWLRTRLRGVSRDQAALILAMLMTRHEGVTPSELLRFGELPPQLRKTLAYLIATEWMDISRDGQHLTFLSPTKRALRS